MKQLRKHLTRIQHPARQLISPLVAATINIKRTPLQKLHHRTAHTRRLRKRRTPIIKIDLPHRSSFPGTCSDAPEHVPSENYLTISSNP